MGKVGDEGSEKNWWSGTRSKKVGGKETMRRKDDEERREISKRPCRTHLTDLRVRRDALFFYSLSSLQCPRSLG